MKSEVVTVQSVILALTQEQYHDTFRTHPPIQSKIHQLVYKRYDLVPGEIKIVEGR